MMRRLYAQLDHAIAQWKETLAEVEQAGANFWGVRQLQRIPGVGPMNAHVFSAIIEEPARFRSKQQLWKYSQLSITIVRATINRLGLPATGPQREPGVEKPLLSRLAHSLQIDHRT
jgi:transposase